MTEAKHHLPERDETAWMLAASPTIWAIHFLLSYATAAMWCGMVVGPYGSLLTARIAIGIYTAVALAAIGAIGLVGFRRHRLGTAEPPHDADTPEDRHRFLGYSTFLLSGLSAVAVLFAALAAVVIEGCQ
jgi:hypothetical protein